MNHYTYEIEFEDGKKYIGVRSCRCQIKDDIYVGSSKLIPTQLYATCKKKILAQFDTRIDAQLDEIARHAELDVARNPDYYNGINAKSVGFSPIGLTKEKSENVKLRAEKFRAYRGDNRTDAQKLADAKLSRYKNSKNSDKGNSGIDSPKFKPWYYITPEGEYVEVYNSIRAYLPTHKVFKTWSPSKIYERISTKAHIPSVKGAVKGYTFGYIFDKPEYLSQENILIALAVAGHIVIENIHKIKQPSKKSLISNITG